MESEIAVLNDIMNSITQSNSFGKQLNLESENNSKYLIFLIFLVYIVLVTSVFANLLPFYSDSVDNKFGIMFGSEQFNGFNCLGQYCKENEEICNNCYNYSILSLVSVVSNLLVVIVGITVLISKLFNTDLCNKILDNKSICITLVTLILLSAITHFVSFALQMTVPIKNFDTKKETTVSEITSNGGKYLSGYYCSVVSIILYILIIMLIIYNYLF